MTLDRLQSAVVRVCMDRQASEEDLSLLGDRRRWMLYREMVRTRLAGLAGNALPRTKSLLGPAFARCVDDWLDGSPPRSPYFREVASEFALFLSEALHRAPEVPRHAADLATLEGALWEVSWARVRHEAASPVPFDFERPPLVSFASRLVTLGFAVHEKEEPAREGRFNVIAFRRPETHAVGTWTVNDTAADIFDEWTLGRGTAADGVRRVCEARGIGRDQKFFEGLAEVVGGLMERGILLGSRGSPGAGGPGHEPP